eukprot:1717377-Amphidinium_carterae.1
MLHLSKRAVIMILTVVASGTCLLQRVVRSPGSGDLRGVGWFADSGPPFSPRRPSDFAQLALALGARAGRAICFRVRDEPNTSY